LLGSGLNQGSWTRKRDSGCLWLRPGGEAVYLKEIGQQCAQIFEHYQQQGVELKALFVDQGSLTANFKAPAWKELEDFLNGSFKGKIGKVLTS